MPIQFIEQDGGVRFAVKVVPGSSRDRIAGQLGEWLKVAVTKPPQGGAANEAVVRLLAEALQVQASAVQIMRGRANPRKEVFVRGLSRDEAARRLGLVS